MTFWNFPAYSFRISPYVVINTEEGFPNAAPAIYRNKLSPGLLSGFLEKVKFSSSSNHNCLYLAIEV